MTTTAKLRRWSRLRRSSKVVPHVDPGRQAASDKFTAATTLPMVVLTIFMVPVLIIPIAFRHLDSGLASAMETADYFIWSIFVFEYLIRLVLAPRRWYFIGHNIPDLVVCAVPMLRPLRLVRSIRIPRLLRLGRLSALAGGGTTKAKHSFSASKYIGYVMVVMGSLILITSAVILDLERDAKTANIKTFGDALWWAISTITTVGYGDRYPVTAGGRAIAAVLMISGIGLLGVITAAIAALFVKQMQSASVVEDRPQHTGAILKTPAVLAGSLRSSTQGWPSEQGGVVVFHIRSEVTEIQEELRPFDLVYVGALARGQRQQFAVESVNGGLERLFRPERDQLAIRSAESCQSLFGGCSCVVQREPGHFVLGTFRGQADRGNPKTSEQLDRRCDDDTGRVDGKTVLLPPILVVAVEHLKEDG